MNGHVGVCIYATVAHETTKRLEPYEAILSKWPKGITRAICPKVRRVCGNLFPAPGRRHSVQIQLLYRGQQVSRKHEDHVLWQPAVSEMPTLYIKSSESTRTRLLSLAAIDLGPGRRQQLLQTAWHGMAQPATQPVSHMQGSQLSLTHTGPCLPSFLQPLSLLQHSQLGGRGRERRQRVAGLRWGFNQGCPTDDDVYWSALPEWISTDRGRQCQELQQHVSAV